jgi:hypothetical protein
MLVFQALAERTRAELATSGDIWRLVGFGRSMNADLVPGSGDRLPFNGVVRHHRHLSGDRLSAAIPSWWLTRR